MSVQPQLEKFSSLTRVIEHSEMSSAIWNEDLQQGGLEEAIAKIETTLGETPACSATRLWWVRCQLEAERLPPAALATPLDEIFEDLKNNPELSLLAASTLYKLSLLLLHRGQSRLGLVMLERSVEVSESSMAVMEAEVLALRESLVVALRQEQARALASREPKKYLESLEKKIKYQEQARKKRAKKKALKKEEPKENGIVSPRLSGKSIVTSALSSEVKSPQTKASAANIEEDLQHTQSNIVPSSTLDTTDAESENFGHQRKDKSSHLGTMLLVILLGSALGLIYWQRQHIFGARPVINSLAMRLPHVESSSLSPPSLKRLAGKVTPLDAVGRRLEELSKRDEEAEKKKKELASETGESEIMKLPKAPEEELISISNELASSEVSVSNSNIPELDHGRFRNTKVESIGTSPMKAPLPASPQELRQDPNGRIYGPPRDNPAVQLPPSSRSLDGSPLRPYEVEQFNPPLRYETLTSTEVLAAPSLLARSLARLEPKTPVDVKARMGLWLELRSTGGNVGYIYAQDAMPLK